MPFDDMAWSSIPSGSPIGVHQLSFDPCLDFAPSVADMSAYSESGGSFFPVSPLVEGGDGDREIVGEIFDGEEPVPVFHTVDHGRHPVISMSFDSTAS
jgi:hypothetical protein